MADELVKSSNALMTNRPDFIPSTQEGTEHMSQEDVQIPRLVIAQAMSPELLEDNSKYIPDLKPGLIFNSLTQRIYGKGPLDFAVVRATKPRWVEFAPREEGGGVVDPDVPENDPRTQFWTDDSGKRRNPVATKFYDFIIVLEPEDAREIVALSLKSTGLVVARALNGLIKLRNAPIYAGIYTASAKMKKNPKGSFYQFDLRSNGWPKSQETFDFLKELYEALKTEPVKIHQETISDSPEEDDSFDFGSSNDSGM